MVLYNIGDQIKWRFEIMAYVYFNLKVLSRPWIIIKKHNSGSNLDLESRSRYISRSRV